ncbi:MAG: TetR/AcrR family transcriptional regulator [Pseudomonadota bacterium]
MAKEPTQPLPPNSRAARRAAFLEVATETFVEFGYDRTSLDDIVARAGGSKSTIYANYGNKEGLFRAIMQDMVDAIFQDTANEETDTEHQGLPVRDRLTHYGLGITKGLCHPRNDAMWRLLMSASWQFPDIAERHYAIGPKSAVADVSAILSDAVARGEIKSIDTRRGAEIFLGSMRHFDVVIGRLLGVAKAPSPAEQKAIVQDAVDTFLGGLATGE